MNTTIAPTIIAIDGHSSCGKSTIAKQLAEHYGFIYVDTGAMYRAVSLYFIRNQVELANSQAVENALKHITISFERINGMQIVHLNEEPVEDFIRSTEINDIVSDVAKISAVRKKLVEAQRLMAKDHSVVMDGRDIGTVVFPNAKIKLFITASIETRAIRRYKELILKGHQVTKEAIQDNLLKRDRIDSSRADSPLKQADDAVLIDNTNLTKEAQLNMLIDLIDSSIK